VKEYSILAIMQIVQVLYPMEFRGENVKFSVETAWDSMWNTAWNFHGNSTEYSHGMPWNTVENFYVFPTEFHGYKTRSVIL